MALETGVTYTNDLVSANPAGGDGRSQGDDHIRNIKLALRNTFPNGDRAQYFKRAVTKAGAYSILATDMEKIFLADASGAAFALALPSLGASNDGWIIDVIKTDASANAVTISGTINGEVDFTISKQYQAYSFLWTGTAWIALPRMRVIAGVPTFPSVQIDGAATIAGLLTLSSTSHWLPPRGTTAQRPGGPAQGSTRYNVTIDLPEWADANGTWRQPSLAQPLPQSKNLYARYNATTPNTKIDWSCDYMSFITATGVVYSLNLTGITFTADGAINGADGLDAGGLANSTWYALLGIYNPSTNDPAALLVKDTNYPSAITLPSGYTATNFIGWFKTDASAHFMKQKQFGKRAAFVIEAATTTMVVLASGVLGDVTAGTYVAKSVVGLVPSTAIAINGIMSGAASALLAPSAGYGPFLSAVKAPYYLTGSPVPFDFLLESTDIYWASNNAGNVALLKGWNLPD